MRATALLLPVLLFGCGRSAPQASGNDAQRQAELIAKQRDALQNEAESNLAADEQALENEGAALFENRAALLNEIAGDQSEGNAAAPTPK